MSNFLTRLIHQFAAEPRNYELIQFVFGGPISYAIIRQAIGSIRVDQVLLDIGGGTGFNKRNLKFDCRYICLDYDLQKLEGSHTELNDVNYLQGDACCLPFGSQSVDLSMLMAVAHHLTDQQFSLAVQEALRVIKPNGRFIYIDPVWLPWRLPGRLLWFLDRGSYPRTRERIREILSGYGQLVFERHYTILHNYIIYILTPREKA